MEPLLLLQRHPEASAAKPAADAGERPPSRIWSNLDTFVTTSRTSPVELKVGDQDADSWPMQLELPVVQPGRSIPAREVLTLQVVNDASVAVTATVYSSAATPFTIEIPLFVSVEVQYW